MDVAIEVAEKLIQKAILQYLRLRGYLCKRNNAGMAFASYNGKKRAFIVGESGWPDIEVVNHRANGQYVGIEVKTRKGVLTEAQIRISQDISKAGGIWFVARSVDDVISHGF